MRRKFAALALWVALFLLAVAGRAAGAAQPSATGSSSSQQLIVAAEATVIENEMFRLEIPAGAAYDPGLEQAILDCCAWVQEASGLSLYPQPNSPKLRITNTGEPAYGGDFGVNVEHMDYLLDTPDALYVYLHELTHTAQYRAVYIECQPFSEGFAILNCVRVAETHGLDYLRWHLTHNNFTYLDPPEAEREIIAADFEHFYRTNSGGWDTYLYGYRFAYYLWERYGANIFTRLVLSYAEQVGTEIITDQNHFVDFLIAQTTPTIFTDFVDWYWQNRELFAYTPPNAL